MAMYKLTKKLQYQERMGRCLLAERERFMGLLGRERQERLQLEEFACSLIQATFRGYQLRQRSKGWLVVSTTLNVLLPHVRPRNQDHRCDWPYAGRETYRAFSMFCMSCGVWSLRLMIVAIIVSEE